MPTLASLKIIRYAVAYVFIVSGLLKLLSPNFATVFSNLGLPFPESTVLLVAGAEIICGCLILFNYYVKKATIPLLVIMVVALLLTKVPILHSGLIQFAFEARLDIVMVILLSILWKTHRK
ncbi:DoxX family protein [Aquibacillus saliphilus]|uniref:DoxX family protein n=1 Tax=Aquibacillus saliphilus TaxID=1909422 RepID=UPI001CF00DD4|nr:DoxX family protein [Aquibacillus saliphilus]